MRACSMQVQVCTIGISVVNSIVCMRFLSGSLLTWLKALSCCGIVSVS